MLLKLDNISDEAVESVSYSFNGLPQTEHLDGKYRLRRYSVIQCNGSCVGLGENTFIQSDEYNKFQGNMTRSFEPIEPKVIESIGMLEMSCMFKDACCLPDDQKIEVHQMRIITLDEETPVSPEGVHQDGFDYICIVGITRYNVTGGHLLIYKDQGDEHFMSLALKPGEVAVINDRNLWHNASSIEPVIGKDGYMDAFILTAKVD
jgi:hypothetical protein